MANQWFRFYGGEYLSDPKMDAFDGNERSCWLTILSLTSQAKDGWIRYTSEEKLLEKSGIKTAERPIYSGILVKFEKFCMIEYCNGDVTQGFRPKNWEKRQYSEGYSRLKRFREKSSNGNETVKSTPHTEQIQNRTEKESKKFTPPSLEEIMNYCNERNNSVNAENFLNFYESKGWLVGKTRMKDWRAAVRTWEARETSVPSKTEPVIPTYFKQSIKK